MDKSQQVAEIFDFEKEPNIGPLHATCNSTVYYCTDHFTK